MKLGIMQPYFFPYLGYFALINAVDLFILFDTPQFIRHGWIERNQILNSQGKPMYIRVPLEKFKRETPINQVKIRTHEAWQSKLLEQLNVYKKRAPFFDEAIALLEKTFATETNSIVELNHLALKNVCEYLEIDTPIKIWSEMDIAIGEVNAPDEWALEICKALDADTYINPTGGLSFFDTDKYKKENIDIRFIEYTARPYTQLSNEFVPYLSVIDVIMFNEKEKIQSYLKDFRLL